MIYFVNEHFITEFDWSEFVSSLQNNILNLKFSLMWNIHSHLITVNNYAVFLITKLNTVIDQNVTILYPQLLKVWRCCLVHIFLVTLFFATTFHSYLIFWQKALCMSYHAIFLSNINFQFPVFKLLYYGYCCRDWGYPLVNFPHSFSSFYCILLGTGWQENERSMW